MSEDSVGWVPQVRTPVAIVHARSPRSPSKPFHIRSSSIGWRQRIPSSLLGRHRAGSETNKNVPDIPVMGQDASHIRNTKTPQRFRSPEPIQLDGSLGRSQSLQDGRPSLKGPQDSMRERSNSRRSKSADDSGPRGDAQPVFVSSPEVQPITTAYGKGPRASQLPRPGPHSSPRREQPGRPAAQPSQQQFLSVNTAQAAGQSSSGESVASASPLSILTTFMLPPQPSQTDEVPTGWNSAGSHERFVEGIEFEMISGPAVFSPISPELLSPRIIESPPSPLMGRIELRPGLGGPPRRPPPPIPSETGSSSSSSAASTVVSAGRASSVLLPESLYRPSGPWNRRRSHSWTHKDTMTIESKNGPVVVPSRPPTPPPKTPGLPATPVAESHKPQQMIRSKSFSAVTPPACPKGSLPRPVSKFNPHKATVETSTPVPPVPPVPSIPSVPPTPVLPPVPQASTSSIPARIALAAAGKSTRRPATSHNHSPSLKTVPSPQPPPVPSLPPACSLPPLTSLPSVPATAKISPKLSAPFGACSLDVERPCLTSKTAPVSRRTSVSKTLKRRSSGSDKGGRNITDKVKKRDNGLTRTRSQARRELAKKMALDNIGAVRPKGPPKMPAKPKRDDDVKPEGRRLETAVKVEKPPSPKPDHAAMLQVQADEQQKIEDLNAELKRLEEQYSKARSHQEALNEARKRLNEIPDDQMSVSSSYSEDTCLSSPTTPKSPKEMALAKLDNKIDQWRKEVELTEHKRNRIRKKLAWHSTDRLQVTVPSRSLTPTVRRPSPPMERAMLRTPKPITPISTALSEFTSVSLGTPVQLPSDLAPAPGPEALPGLLHGKYAEARRPSVASITTDTTGNCSPKQPATPSPPSSPLATANMPWIGLDWPFTPLSPPEPELQRIAPLTNRRTMHPDSTAGAGASTSANGLLSPNPRSDRQMTIQVFAEDDITADLVACLQEEIESISRHEH